MMRQRLATLARRLRGWMPRLWTLMHHRVADLVRDLWGLAVHPARFAEQLEVLVRQRTPLPLDDFVAQLGQAFRGVGPAQRLIRRRLG